MYQQFYGLAERPFDLTPNPRYLLLTPSHREALANLDYGISARAGLIVVTGEAGTGKTTLLRRVMSKGVSGPSRARNVRTVYLANPTLDRREFVEYPGAGLRPPAGGARVQGAPARRIGAGAGGVPARRYVRRPHHRRGPEPAVRADGRGAAACEHRVRYRQALAGRARWTARTGRSAQRAGAPASRNSVFRCAAGSIRWTCTRPPPTSRTG